ncbi:hypothetical protein DV515_00007741 [Chloebia gouldiae]|uniref:Uncharacterized protein n=1 Tax=Chloebia gouldiae TaxID=44316 RepID=A0A3L8SHJ5_CHLGU|nr:hypothetical protein DV515_00007741 [Chloebia gouldiae]
MLAAGPSQELSPVFHHDHSVVYWMREWVKAPSWAQSCQDDIQRRLKKRHRDWHGWVAIPSSEGHPKKQLIMHNSQEYIVVWCSCLPGTVFGKQKAPEPITLGYQGHPTKLLSPQSPRMDPEIEDDSVPYG